MIYLYVQDNCWHIILYVTRSIFFLADPNFFEDKTDDVRAYESLNEKWMDQRDFGCDDYFNCKDHWSQDISFGSWNLQDRRSASDRNIFLFLPLKFPS